MTDGTKKVHIIQQHKKNMIKNEKIACTVFNEKYDIIKKHSQEQGFTSINSYALSLIDNDLKSNNNWLFDEAVRYNNGII